MRVQAHATKPCGGAPLVSIFDHFFVCISNTERNLRSSVVEPSPPHKNALEPSVTAKCPHIGRGSASSTYVKTTKTIGSLAGDSCLFIYFIYLVYIYIYIYIYIWVGGGGEGGRGRNLPNLLLLHVYLILIPHIILCLK